MPRGLALLAESIEPPCRPFEISDEKRFLRVVEPAQALRALAVVRVAGFDALALGVEAGPAHAPRLSAMRLMQSSVSSQALASTRERWFSRALGFARARFCCSRRKW